MHLVFIDAVDWPWRVDAPFHRALGGTQSAMAYLMLELAKRGIKVSLINMEPPHEVGGVRGLSTQFSSSEIADATAFIVCSDPTPDHVGLLARYAPGAKKILWQHHAPDQAAVQPMADSEVMQQWDAVVFVSEWQKQEYLKRFPNLADKTHVILRNAISPVFESLFDDLPVLPFKSPAPRFAYSSMPFRGLDRLLYGWHRIIAAHPSAQLQIFSSMKLYNQEDAGNIETMLDAARQMPGVIHVGAVPQAELAQQLRSTLIFSYPNTFPETACIAAMEAMAAGCIVITSDIGALPETLGGYGEIVKFQEDGAAHAFEFADHAVNIVAQLKSEWQDGKLEKRLAAQVAWAQQTYSWRTRAGEWEKALRDMSV